MKKVLIRVTNQITKTVEDHWLPINAGMEIEVEGQSIVDFKVIDIQCDPVPPSV